MGLRSYLARTPAIVTVAAIAFLEVQSALHRRYRLGQITPEDLSRGLVKVKNSADNVRIVSMGDELLADAANLLQTYGLRSLDALQMQSVLYLRGEIGPENDLLFIASDRRLLEAVSGELSAVWNPELGSQPAN